ncbi:hypothetical protein [Bartonella sp. B41]
MTPYVYFFTLVILLGIEVVDIYAATVKNTDLVVQSLIVTEGGMSSMISLNHGQTVIICMKGCFVVFPNKDHFVVMADDNIEISESRAIFK